MTHTNNDELVEIALKIAAKYAESKAARNVALTLAEYGRDTQRMEQRAMSLDDDICQLCTDMRNACLPVAA